MHGKSSFSISKFTPIKEHLVYIVLRLFDGSKELVLKLLKVRNIGGKKWSKACLFFNLFIMFLKLLRNGYPISNS